MTSGQIRITEEFLKALNFEKVLVTKEQSGNKEDYHYYILDLAEDKGLTLISNASDEENFPTLHFMDVPDYKFTTAEPIIVLLNILEDNHNSSYVKQF
jgi:hypothetical protein